MGWALARPAPLQRFVATGRHAAGIRRACPAARPAQPHPPPPCPSWMHRFLRPAPAPDSLLGAGVDYGSGREVSRRVAVGQVLDIEESIWSTKYGVKGMVDVRCGAGEAGGGGLVDGTGPPCKQACLR
jgi:hypothetical protein